MFKIKKLISLVTMTLFLGCQDTPKDGPAKVHWDRDMCDRCVMVLSDRKNSVQLRHPTTNKVYKFDDIGCMVLWFDEENIDFKDSAKIWVTDVNSGEWIDARSAFYTPDNVTPMAFGFSAYSTKESIKDGAEILTYDEVIKKIK